jgi:hypothetical protein
MSGTSPRTGLHRTAHPVEPASGAGYFADRHTDWMTIHPNKQLALLCPSGQLRTHLLQAILVVLGTSPGLLFISPHRNCTSGNTDDTLTNFIMHDLFKRVGDLDTLFVQHMYSILLSGTIVLQRQSCLSVVRS